MSSSSNNRGWIQQLDKGFLFDIAIDTEKNIYVGGNDIGAGSWIAKYDSTGTKLWEQSVDIVDATLTGDITGTHLEFDDSNNIQVAGYVYSFSDVYPEYAPFIVKYDSGGDRQWQQQLEFDLQVSAARVVGDNVGNFYIAGPSIEDNFVESQRFWTIAKYNSSGDREWVQKQPFFGFGNLSDFSLDDAGNIYLTGNIDNGGSYSSLVAKYDSSGNQQWNRNLGIEIDYPGIGPVSSGAAVDNAGNVYVTANAAVYFYYRGNPEPAPTATTLAKYDSSGNLQWQKLWEDTSSDVEVDRDGNIYVSVTEGINKYDGEGNLVWEQQLTSTLSSYSGFELDGDGKAYFMGGQANPWLAKLDINAGANAIANNGITLDEGVTTTITSNELKLDDTEVDRVAYTITALPTSGSLKLNNVELALDGGFTQADIDGGNLTYIHDGSDTTSDIFGFIAIDGLGVGIEGDFQIAVNPVNDAPTDITLSQNTIAENSETDTAIGNLTTTDSDSDAHTYTLVENPDGRFAIVGNQLKVAEGSKLDFETNSSHTIKVRATDNGEPAQSFEKELVIEVTDVNDAPTDITLSQNSIAENSATGAVIGQLTTTDSDSDTHSYSLMDDAEGLFVIEGNELKVADGSKLDFETNSSHTIKVRATDNGEPAQSLEKEFAISIANVNEAPTDITLGQNTIAENSETDTAIGGLTTTDGDSDAHTYTLVENSDGRFAIVGNQLKVADGSKLDFETDSSHTIKVRATDNGEPAQSLEKELTVAVTDIKDGTVKSSSSYTLEATKENLTLTGIEAINGTGNQLDNLIEGNNAKNRINGKAGKDTLIGRGGNDVLTGGAGNDNLNGGKGNDNLNGGKGRDRMTGGAGNDTFVVDNVKDVVTERAKGGKDLVKSSVSYSLPGRVENLTLTGKKGIKGTGNNLSNRIVGNDGKNRLNGKGGNDVLTGGGGNDTLIGGGGGDRLIGNQGNDLLDGGVGKDTLTGGGGSDRFIFNTGKSYRQASPGRDVIRDFKNRDNDKIILDKTTFAALRSKVGNGFSVIAEFDVVKRDAAVASSDAVIVYNENNGKLFYNANGSKNGLGAGGVFAVLDNSPGLQANDFILRR